MESHKQNFKWGVTERYLQNYIYIPENKQWFYHRLFFCLSSWDCVFYPRTPKLLELGKTIRYYEFEDKGQAILYYFRSMKHPYYLKSVSGMRCSSSPVLFCLSNEPQYHNTKIMQRYVEECPDQTERGKLKLLNTPIEHFKYRFVTDWTGTIIKI